MKITRKQLRETIRRLTQGNNQPAMLQDVTDALDIIHASEKTQPPEHQLIMAISLVEPLIDEFEELGDKATLQQIYGILSADVPSVEDLDYIYDNRRKEYVYWYSYYETFKPIMSRLKRLIRRPR
jgi:hypothetical protein